MIMIIIIIVFHSSLFYFIAFYFVSLYFIVAYFCPAPLSTFVRSALQIPLIDWLIDWYIDWLILFSADNATPIPRYKVSGCKYVWYYFYYDTIMVSYTLHPCLALLFSCTLRPKRSIMPDKFSINDSMTCGFTDVYTNYGGLTTRHFLTDEPPRLVCLSLWFVLYYLSFFSLCASHVPILTQL